MVNYAAPRRQRLVAGGEALRSWGLALEPGGRRLGPAPERCGNAALLRELQEISRSGVPASALDKSRVSSGPTGTWFGEDLRGRAMLFPSTRRGQGGPDGPQRRAAWPTDLACRAGKDRRPRPNPTGGGGSSSNERELPRCGSGAVITPDELPTLANPCAISPGLFWSDGHGYYHRALLHAVLTVYGYREVATSWTRMANTCELDADWIRRHVENRSGWIGSTAGTGPGAGWFFSCPNHAPQLTIDGRGLVILDRPIMGWSAISAVRVDLCAKYYKGEAALADYYFWWAHRLYSYYMDGEGTRLHWLVGLLCARCALAEIVEIGAVILHESAHRAGSWFHCAPTDGQNRLGSWGVGVAFLLGGWVGALVYARSHLGDAAEIGELDCCQYSLDAAFTVRLTAALGLPPSHASASAYLGGLTADRRFEVAFGGTASGSILMPGDCVRAGSSGRVRWS